MKSQAEGEASGWNITKLWVLNAAKKKQNDFSKFQFEQRLDFIVKEYGNYSKKNPVGAIIRIKKTWRPWDKNAVNFLLEDDVSCFAILLRYCNLISITCALLTITEFKTAKEIIKCIPTLPMLPGNLKLILKHTYEKLRQWHSQRLHMERMWL